MNFFMSKMLFPILKHTTKMECEWANRAVNWASQKVNCSLLRKDPRIVGALRAAVWITGQPANGCTIRRIDDANNPYDEILRGDGKRIPVKRYPILQQLSYSKRDGIKSEGITSFWGGKNLESSYNQVLSLAKTPLTMGAQILIDSQSGLSYDINRIATPAHDTTIEVGPFKRATSYIIKVLATGVCGTDLRALNAEKKEIESGTTLGHEVLGVVAAITGVAKSIARVGDLVNVIPHFWCGVCLNCRNGQTNFCESRKHLGFEKTAQGGFAQYIAVPAENIIIHPGNMTYDGKRRAFSILEPAVCCLHGRELMKDKPGDPDKNPYADKKVLVLGAGPIGCMHGKIAKMDKASSVTLADIKSIHPNKMGHLIRRKEQGIYDHLVIYDDHPNEKVEEAFADIKAKLGENNASFDVIILAASHRKAYELSLKLIADKGKIMFFSGLPMEERIPLVISAAKITLKDVALRPIESSNNLKKIENSNNYELNIHEIHHHDQILEVQKDNGISFKIVGSQGFYPGFEGQLWNDFSEENLRKVAEMNPSLFITNEIELDLNEPSSRHKDFSSLVKEKHKEHLKNIVLIGHNHED